ncbi:MAG TPA: DUF3592 domain-containing protein [Acidobacteriaceae bacterium]|nr:DUF3592 domain-containing protein [Acidobacteriaceae bacterium]
MGFVIDIFVAFLFRLCAKWFRRIRSRKWPIVTATVLRAHVERHGYGCHVVRIPYSYRVDAQRYAATHGQPILFGSGDDWVRDFPSGKKIHVRYKPDDPARSVALI